MGCLNEYIMYLVTWDNWSLANLIKNKPPIERKGYFKISQLLVPPDEFYDFYFFLNQLLPDGFTWEINSFNWEDCPCKSSGTRCRSLNALNWVRTASLEQQ